MGLARTKAEASRALAQSDVAYLVEVEVVNESDARTLASFVSARLKKDKKLRVFVAERITKQR